MLQALTLSSISCTSTPSLRSIEMRILVLVLEVVENNLDLLLGLDVDFQIVLGAGLGVPTNDILAHHDKGHEQYLNEV